LENPWSVPLAIVEVQKGELLSEEDIVRLEDDYKRADTRVVSEE
jgi:mannose-6-phosphate isomerase-like protein (cupin superfamily)